MGTSAEIIGKVLSNRYQIKSKIGEGGMATVYLASDKLMNRDVAIKILSKQFSSDDLAVERFRREAQFAGRLNHPNIVSVHDLGQHDDSFYIIMEYVRGKALSELINESPIPHKTVKSICVAVASALGWAHQNGVVHRDVKSGNIIINSEGVAKITDFGIAFIEQDHSLTKTGSVLGTATNFAPEQACGDKGDSRSDLYSLGVVMYEMLTGKLPFNGASAVAIAYKHVQERPPEFDESLEIPEYIENIVKKLLAKNPEDRYQTAEDFLIALNSDSSGFEPESGINRLNIDKGSTENFKPIKNSVFMYSAAAIICIIAFSMISVFLITRTDEIELSQSEKINVTMSVTTKPELPDLLSPSTIKVSETTIVQTEEDDINAVLGEGLAEEDEVDSLIEEKPQPSLKYKIVQSNRPSGDCFAYDNVNTFSTVMNTAMEQIGKPYKKDIEVTWEEDPKGFDSGEFVDWAFSNAGIRIGETPRESFNLMNKCEYGIGVKWGMKRAGTVMFAFQDVDPKSNTGRMAISLGTGKHVIEATEDGGVIVVEIDDPTAEFSKAQFVKELGAGKVELN